MQLHIFHTEIKQQVLNPGTQTFVIILCLLTFRQFKAFLSHVYRYLTYLYVMVMYEVWFCFELSILAVFHGLFQYIIVRWVVKRKLICRKTHINVFSYRQVENISVFILNIIENNSIAKLNHKLYQKLFHLC